MRNTKIEWADHSANIWEGCTKVGPMCDNCYAETTNHRWGKDNWGNDKPRLHVKSFNSNLNKYQKEAAAAGEIHTVFVGSMMDIFEKPMPLTGKLAPKEGDPLFVLKDGAEVPLMTDQLRTDFFEKISAGTYPNLLFLLLTKRPSNINKYIPEAWRINGAPNNVMFGCSPDSQHDIGQLLQVKGRLFLSCEPLLGPLMLTTCCPIHATSETPPMQGYMVGSDDGKSTLYRTPGEALSNSKIEWVIAGGESGHHARPSHPDWFRSLRDQCAAAGVKFHFKQWGEWIAMSQATHPVELEDGETYKIELKFPDNGILKKDGETFIRSGKKANGRRLDGKEHNALATD